MIFTSAVTCTNYHAYSRYYWSARRESAPEFVTRSIPLNQNPESENEHVVSPFYADSAKNR